MWDDDKIKYLIENYGNTQNNVLCNVLNITEKALTSKAYRLGLKKTKKHKSEMIGKRNKIVGRDLNYDNLKKIAILYKSRGEFQNKDSSAYSVSQKNGILDDICGHMVKQSFSIPQLILKNILDKLFNIDSNYNDRVVIKPYEIDVYYPTLKLGFEYNGYGWHVNNRNDELKNKKAKDKNITIITINENHRKYEKDIKEQLIKNLHLINKFTKNYFTEENILNMIVDDIYSSVYDIESMFKIASNYKNKKEFRTFNRKIYDKLYKIGKLQESTKYFIK